MARMGASQRGAIVGGAWLVGLGAVFLVQQGLDLSWGEAWPLFIILAGVGIGIGAVAGLAGRRVSARMVAWALLWPVLITIVGVLLFVDLAGLADVDAFGLLARWWPLALIVVGAFVLLGALLPRSRGVDQRLSIPVAGASGGEVNLKFGAGRLDVVRGTPGMLVDGTFEGGVRRRDLGPGRVELEGDAAAVWSWPSDGLHWTVGLAPDLPITLRLEGGASRSVLDLADLDVRSLTVKTGASDTRIRLPREVGHCEVRVEAGAAQVSIEVPPGVAARIRSQMGLGSTNVDEARFPRSAEGWASPDYAAASRQVDIRASGGVGTVKVA
jgi:hypothetical protein